MKSHFHIKVWAARLTLRKIEAKSNTEMGYCPGLEPGPLDSDFSIADQEDHSAPEPGPTARTVSGGLINCHGNQFQPHVVLATTCCCIQRQTFFPAMPDITQGLDV